MTARELISSALRLGGVLASGESPSANEANDALLVLNQMLSSWSNENLVVYQKTREEFNLTPGTASYTWGLGGDFNSSRPVEVLEAKLLLQNSDLERTVHILTTKEYADLSLKNTQGAIPEGVYFDGGYPLVNTTFYQVPSNSEKAVFYSLKPFSTLNLNSVISYPPGYEHAVRYGLWMVLAPEFGYAIDPDLREEAKRAKAEIKRKNYQVNALKTDLPTNSCGKGSSLNRIFGG